MSDEIRDILSRIGEVTERNLIQAVLLYLRTSESTSRTAQKAEFLSKKDEIEVLSLFATQHNYWYSLIDDNQYIGEGTEQQVFLNKDGRSVPKSTMLFFTKAGKTTL